MVLLFVSRVLLLIAQRSIERLLRCSCFIIDQLHEHIDPGCVGKQISPAHSEPKTPSGTPPSPYVDVFETPYFVSTDYKDGRAAVNIANISSHAHTQAHSRKCECKTCRDRRPAFPRTATGRRHGYKGAPIYTRTAAVDLGAASQSIATPEKENQNRVPNLRAGKSPPSLPPQRSRLRGGDLRNLHSEPNRFASLPVERTKDEDEYQPCVEDSPARYATKALKDCLEGASKETSDNFRRRSRVSLLRTQIAAPLECEVDSDLGEDDLQSSGSESSPPSTFPFTAHAKSFTSLTLPPCKANLPLPPCTTHPVPTTRIPPSIAVRKPQTTTPG